MASSSVFDVVILGYGPVGAVLANLLGRDGLSVAVVDRMDGIYDKPRAINVDHEVMRLLQSVGLAEAVDAIASHHTGTDFRGVDGRLIKVFDPMPPPYPLGWAPNLMFIQPEFEPILRGGVARFANVEVRLGTEAIALAQDADEIRLTLRSGDGTQLLRGRYLLACDGGASPTRKWLGIGQESLDFDEWWTVVDAWLKRPTPLPARTTQFCRPSGPATYVVGPRGLRRWELKLMPGESPADYDDIAAVRRRLAGFVDTDAIEIWRTATYRFHALVAEAWREGRVLLAGDAAHQMPPFMAQGLCSGIRDAGNLAWKLTAVLRDGWPASLLDSYQTERKPHIRALVATTKAIGLIIGELDAETARVRDERLGEEVASGRSERVRQKLIPDLTAGLIATAPDGRPVPPAGTLSPQPRVVDPSGREDLLDAFVGPHFLLLSLGIEPQHWPNENSNALWNRLGGRRAALVAEHGPSQPGVIAVREQGRLLTDWMERTGCRVVLVRPDKYVFGAAADRQTLDGQFAALAAAVFGTSRPHAAGHLEATPQRRGCVVK